MTRERIIALMLVLASGGLAIDLRYEHAGVLAANPVAEVPIVFAICVFCLGLAGIVFWNHGGRELLLLPFLVCFFISLMGFYWHTHGHPVDALKGVLWPGGGSPDGPPPLAPLAFALIGAIGSICCWPRSEYK